jgi:hypothetical protein
MNRIILKYNIFINPAGNKKKKNLFIEDYLQTGRRKQKMNTHSAASLAASLDKQIGER